MDSAGWGLSGVRDVLGLEMGVVSGERGQTPRTRPRSRRGGSFIGVVVRQRHPDMRRGEGNPNGGPALRRSWVTSGRFPICTGKSPSVPPPPLSAPATFVRLPRQPTRAASSTTAGVCASEVSSLEVVGFSPCGLGFRVRVRVWPLERFTSVSNPRPRQVHVCAASGTVDTSMIAGLSVHPR